MRGNFFPDKRSIPSLIEIFFYSLNSTQIMKIDFVKQRGYGPLIIIKGELQH